MAIKEQIQNISKSYAIDITVIATIIGLIFGAFQYIDITYAKDKDVSFLGYKIDIKILDDRSHNLQRRIWELEDRKALLDKRSDSESVLIINKQLRETKTEKQKIDDELSIVIEQYKQIGGNIHK